MEKRLKTAVILTNNPSLRNQIGTDLRHTGIELVKSTGNAQIAFQAFAESRKEVTLFVSDLNVANIPLKNIMTELRKHPRMKNIHVFAIATREQQIKYIDACVPLGLSGIIPFPFKSNRFLDNFLNLWEQRFAAKSYSNLAIHSEIAANHYESIKQLEKALTYYEKAFSLSKAAQPCFDAGRLHAFLGHTDKANKCFNDVLTIDPALAEDVQKFLKLHKLHLIAQQRAMSIPDIAIKIFGFPPANLGDEIYGVNRLKKAYLVIDSMNLRSSMKVSLGNMGIETSEATRSGRDAVDFLSKAEVDLIVCSSVFSDMNFLQFLELMSATKRQNRKFFALIDRKELANLPMAFELGLDGFLFVPFTANELREALHHMMVVSDLTRESGPATPYARAAALLWLHERLDNAIDVARRGMTVFPDGPICSIFLGLGLIQKRQTEEGDQYIQRVMGKQPRLAPLLLRLLDTVQAKLRQKETEGAEETTVEATPDEPTPVTETPLPEIALEETSVVKEAPVTEAPLPDRPITEAPFPEEPRKERPPPIELTEDDFKLPADINQELSDSLALDEGEAVGDGFTDLMDLLNRTGKQLFASENSTPLEGVTFEGQIEPELVSLGVTQVNLAQSGMEEHVVRATEVHKGDQQFPETDSSPVQTWLEPKKLEKLELPATSPLLFSPENQNKVNTWVEELKKNKADILTLINQAQLFNTRLWSQEERDHDEVLRYYEALGAQVLNPLIAAEIDKSPNNFTPQTLHLLKLVGTEKKSDKANLRSLGKMTFMSGHASDLFTKAEASLKDIAAWPVDQPESLKKIHAMIEAVLALEKPIKGLHKKYFQGKQEFEKSLPKAIATLKEKSGEERWKDLNKALDADHDSLEGFKKIFTFLKEEGDEEALRSFFDKKSAPYLKNRDTRDALGKFLIAVGENLKAEYVFETVNREYKDDPDVLKKLAFLSYRNGLYEKTLEWCKSLINCKRAQDIEDAYNLSGAAYKKLNRLGLAIKKYLQGLSLVPDSLKLNYNLAIAYAANNEREKAVTALNTAKRLKESQERKEKSAA
ncbi:MAG: hypothetical protein HYW48_11080 [Deltaproteobacteria bacterium]|nr:hypothetical protein [Deltaproteobacteria bacterium]